MREEGLFLRIKSRQKYSSYKGEISPEVPNLVQRDFHAECPNQKWLTDITEFAIPAGKVYLSSIVDCFDGMLPAWTISEYSGLRVPPIRDRIPANRAMIPLCFQ